MFNPEHARPIEAESIDQHAKELRKRLQIIQLSFADSKFLEEKEKNGECDFLDILEKYTPIGKDNVKREYEARYPDKKKDLEEFWALLSEEIKNIHEQKADNWEEEISNLTAKKVDALGPINMDHSSEKSNRAGMIKYNLDKGNQDFEKFGIGIMEPYIEIHFGEAYRQEGGVGHMKLRESFEKLAQDIVEKYPETQFVIGRSWILDHQKIADRIGFKIVEKTDSLDHFSTWWQLMDKDGQIGKEQMKRFREEGKLHFQVALGIIPVEEFLKKHLPNEMRGKIKLKKMKDEDREKMLAFNEERKIFGEKFEQMSKEEIVSFIKEASYLRDNFETDEVQYLVSLLCEMKDKGINLMNPGEDYAKRMKEIRKSMEKFLPAVVEKEIFIEPRK
ncbi:MAG TPA: hypothetical protein P5323_02625 [Candidatus Moranbacteria bacterium]|nr:hypothetical protein [Candidatus Moranbacteria bacterium]HRY28007.1 hypothetical protein [Candidatus Moranbacteria bacterium]HSA07918.1 hypothetical protein [Candidatus Moranbacteria bacterium]